MTKKLQIKDIYEGDYIQIWEDGEKVYINIEATVVSVSKDDWAEIKKEFKKAIE